MNEKTPNIGKDKRIMDQYSSDEECHKKLKKNNNNGKTQNKRGSVWHPPLKLSPKQDNCFPRVNSDIEIIQVNQSQNLSNNMESETELKKDSQRYVINSYTSVDYISPEMDDNINKLAVSNKTSALLDEFDNNRRSVDIDLNYSEEDFIAGPSISHLSSIETLPFHSESNSGVDSSSSQYSTREEDYVRSLINRKDIQFDQLGSTKSNPENLDNQKTDVLFVSDMISNKRLEENLDLDPDKNLIGLRETNFNDEQHQEISDREQKQQISGERNIEIKIQSPDSKEYTNKIDSTEYCTNKDSISAMPNLEPVQNSVPIEAEANSVVLNPSNNEISLAETMLMANTGQSLISCDRPAIVLRNNEHKYETTGIISELKTAQENVGLILFNKSPPKKPPLKEPLPKEFPPKEPKKDGSTKIDESIDDNFEPELVLTNSQLQQIEKQYSKSVSQHLSTQHHVPQPHSDPGHNVCLNQAMSREKQILQNIINEIESLNEMVLEVTKDIKSRIDQPTSRK